jgi:hypothetical protein
MGLLWTTINKHEVAPAYPQKVTVTENRAPTDDSVKLLREMEEKAKQQVIESFIADSNEIKGAVVRMQRCAMTPDTETWVTFVLNGERVQVRVEISDQVVALDSREAQRLLIETLAKKITDWLARRFLHKGTDNG